MVEKPPPHKPHPPPSPAERELHFCYQKMMTYYYFHLLANCFQHSPSLQERAGGEALSYAERKEQQKKIRKAQRAVDESEAKIAKLEARKSELDELLMAPENASNMELVTEYTNLQRELDEENERWLILSEELETLNIEL